MTTAKEFEQQLLWSNVPAGIAEKAAIDLANGLGAADSQYIAAAYKIIADQEPDEYDY